MISCGTILDAALGGVNTWESEALAVAADPVGKHNEYYASAKAELSVLDGDGNDLATINSIRGVYYKTG